VNCICEKVRKNADPEKTNKELLCYAYFAGRNWAIDKRKHDARAAKKKTAEIFDREQKRKEEQRKCEEEQIFVKAREEFYRLVATLSPSLTQFQLKFVEMVQLTCFEHVTMAQCAERFPGNTLNALYLRKFFGIRLLQPYASPDLLHILSRKLPYSRHTKHKAEHKQEEPEEETADYLRPESRLEDLLNGHER
jgi:hypothetical protein